MQIFGSFQSTTLCREREKQNIRILLVFPMAGIELGLPAQQASMLSITTLPLDLAALVGWQGYLLTQAVFSVNLISEELAGDRYLRGLKCVVQTQLVL